MSMNQAGMHPHKHVPSPPYFDFSQITDRKPNCLVAPILPIYPTSRNQFALDGVYLIETSLHLKGDLA